MFLYLWRKGYENDSLNIILHIYRSLKQYLYVVLAYSELVFMESHIIDAN